MPTVTINGRDVEIGAGEKLNCIEAAKRVGVEIPHYCWHPALSVVASCRMCLVEVGEKKPDGTVAMQPKVFPGCQTPVKDGMVIVSDSPKVKDAQKATLEYLLLNHPLDCPVCDQAGECGLQDYSYEYGRGYSRLQEPKNIKPDKDYIGDQITLFTDRCIMCTRCVRFTREYSGTAELQVTHRGSGEEIDIFPGEPCNNKLAGNVVDLCPVGALCSKDFLYEQRVWWLKSKDSVCAGCSTGCSIRIDQNEDQIYRLKPRENLQAQGYFMCDDGRFDWKYVQSEHRLKSPVQRTNSQSRSQNWEQILPAARQAIRDKIAIAPARFAAVLSPWMTVEEAYLLARFLKSESEGVQLVLGPVRVVGSDDHYPKDVRGNAEANVRFTIRAEKCPNRAGVEAVIGHFETNPLDYATFLAKAKTGEFTSLFLVGGDPAGWMNGSDADFLTTCDLVIVQDILESDASRHAHFVFPGGSWAERDGTFVSATGLAQSIQRSIHGPEDARPDGRILWDLAERTGLFNAPTLRKEIAKEISGLSALGVGQLGSDGVRIVDQSVLIAKSASST